MRQSNKRGFTFLELTMAMAITSVTALSVAGVSMGLSRAYANSEGYYQTSQNARSAMMGMQSLLRKAKLVLNVSDNGVVFWAQDVNGDGQINRTEVTTLIYDKEKRELRTECISFSTLSVASQTTLDINLPLATAMVEASVSDSSLQRDCYAQSRVLASNVTDFQASAWPVCPLAKTVRMQFTVAAGEQETTLRSAVTLRANSTSDVIQAGGSYVLSPG